MPTPTLTKFSDSIKAIRTDSASDIKAAAVATSASRLASVKASAASTDPKKRDAYLFAKKGVERLGFSLDSIAAGGGSGDLDKRMSELKWTNEQRIQLKTALASCGAIA
jgi:hypothetical protein